MNRRSQSSLPVSKATTGFLQYKAAEGLSPNTLQSYQRDLKLWQIYAGDIPVHQLSTKLIQDFFVWLRTDYQPRRLSGKRHPLAAKTIHNFYVSLSAFFTWASREFSLPNPIKAVPASKFEQAPIEPFSLDEGVTRLNRGDEITQRMASQRTSEINRGDGALGQHAVHAARTERPGHARGRAGEQPHDDRSIDAH